MFIEVILLSVEGASRLVDVITDAVTDGFLLVAIELNPHMEEVVRAEVLKLLQAGIIYPISDSPWDAKFVWDERYLRSFDQLKQFLTTASIVRAPNWQLPFEVMCDASDFAIGAVLGQREDGKPYVIYYTKFNLQIKDKKGVENVVADHLSRLAIAQNSHVLHINDDFPEESLMLLGNTPWYAHIANYLVTGEIPSEWKAQDTKHFFAKIHAYYWEEPFLFKYCADQIIRKCVPEEEQQGILNHCHESALGVYYVSKWVEAIPCKHNDHRVVLKFLKENIFSRFGVPKAIISDGGTHFCNKPFETLLAKYGVKHKVATPYHPQTSILEHLGYHFEPQLERRHICREIFTLDKWTSMTAYDAQLGAPTGLEHLEIPQPKHPEEPRLVEIPADMRAPAPIVPSTGPMPDVASSTPPATLGTPPVVPAASEPHPSESRIAISISEFRGLCHTLQILTATQSILTQQMAAIRAHQDQLIATQTQHTAILRQI
ncbi:uncharacterized protein LOC117930479 [Vitis riparia]|uniref:uncharacterized protein LOC117930479 n=1 Tax=Vitis riparia TaxID=96939 RepID=UPI00155ACA2F|nr:uncharacterized protein LOC117930479 [Vitis riparia]